MRKKKIIIFFLFVNNLGDDDQFKIEETEFFASGNGVPDQGGVSFEG